MITHTYQFATITLNPAIDHTLAIPNFQVGTVNRVESERRNAGGKGVNVAAALARAGHRVAATGFLGQENSAIFEEFFDLEEIGDRFVRIQGATRTGIKVTDATLQQTTDINFPGAVPGSSDLAELNETINSLVPKWFVIAGSLPPGIDPDIYRHLTAQLKERGIFVALDASGESLRRALSARPNLIKPNIDELEELVGHPIKSSSDVAQAAANLVSLGIDCVVVSLGAEGACFTTKEGSILAVPPTVEVQTTVGAGDAMVAGILSSNILEYSTEDTARVATAFSLKAITKSSLSIEDFALQVTLSKL